MIKILFVCHGNICRSPMAQYYMNNLLEQRGYASFITASSAATSREEIGNPVYPPARKILAGEGISCEGHKAREVTGEDYKTYDLILPMDQENLRSLRRLWPEDPEGKIHLLLDYTSRPGEVADPWYTGDFRQTLHDIQEGCEGLLSSLLARRKKEKR